MAIIDVCTFNGEHDIWDIHYNVLKDYVDEFIILEFDKTFSGKPKARTFGDPGAKVTYHFVTESQYSEYYELAKSNPHTEYGNGAEHWVREFAQKESIKDFITHLGDDDLVLVGDVDEIIDLTYIPAPTPARLWLRVYTYYLNNRSSEIFWGTLVARYRDIRDVCLNELRSDTSLLTGNYHGWHFTSMGGADRLRRKLTDSYTEETYATPDVIDNLERNIKSSTDFLGRGFTYVIDESEWPSYLKQNRVKYQHLLR